MSCFLIIRRTNLSGTDFYLDSITMKTGHYINKRAKLRRLLKRYLKGLEKLLIQNYGRDKAQSIVEKSGSYYPAIIEKMPYVNTPMYDSLIVVNSRMLALKKGLKDEGVGVEEFVALMLEDFRIKRGRIPKAIRNLLGKIFLSRLMRIYLRRVAVRVTANGWPTELISGSSKDDFTMKICTRDCQMVNFMKAVGEDDLIPHCSFADFAMAESLGYSLKQTSTIDSGVCTFCFSTKAKVYWSEALSGLRYY